MSLPPLPPWPWPLPPSPLPSLPSVHAESVFWLSFGFGLGIGWRRCAAHYPATGRDGLHSPRLADRPVLGRSFWRSCVRPSPAVPPTPSAAVDDSEHSMLETALSERLICKPTVLDPLSAVCPKRPTIAIRAQIIARPRPRGRPQGNDDARPPIAPLALHPTRPPRRMQHRHADARERL